MKNGNWKVIGLVAGCLSGAAAIVELVADSKTESYNNDKLKSEIAKEFGLTKVESEES